MAERVLVTGAAGFIGSHLVDALIGRGATVAGIDNFDPFYPAAIKRANLGAATASDRFTLIEGDIRDRAMLERVLRTERPDVVVHLAARAGVRPSIADPAGYAEVNVAGTAAVLVAACAAGIERIVVASSSSVYGNDAKAPFHEDEPALHPISPYAATKRAAELMCDCQAALHPALRVISLRFFTVYGPRQRPDLAIHSFTRLITRGAPVPIFGDGNQSRDYTYVTDTIQGVLGAIDRTAGSAGSAGHEIFNLGESATTTLRELVALLENAIGQRAILDRRPRQPGDVEHTYADISRARALLGYAPTVPIRDGIPAFVAWFRATEGGIAMPA